MRYVRLISFNYKIEDLSTCAALSLDEPPRELHAVGTIADCHKEVVLSPAFSPNNFLLVTGCRVAHLHGINLRCNRYCKVRSIYVNTNINF